MNSLIGTLGPGGLACVLTVVLFYGTKGEGRANALGWGWTLILSVFAGASYAAADWPFSIVRDLVDDGIELLRAFYPKVTYPAIGLCMLAIIAWRKLTRRGVALLGIPFWYVAALADGGLGILATRIAAACDQLAA